MAQAAETLGGRFRLEAQVGRGGMGTVYSGVDLHDGSRVAVKRITTPSTDDVKRFLREAKVLSRLTHPAIVGYRAHGLASDGGLFLAMEWLEGEDLASRLRRERLSPEEAIALLRRLADALAVVHDHGLVHRDLKPANVFLVHGDCSQAKLVDFGVVHVSRTIHRTRSLTSTGAIVGTPGYLSPEQVRAGGVDGRADLFALGCIAFECLAGRPAFVADTLMALLARIVIEPSPSLAEVRPDLPQDLTRLVAQLLEKDPSLRPANGREIGARLDAIGALRTDEAAEASGVRAAAAPLTSREQRIVSIVAAAGSSTADDDVTIASAHDRAFRDRLTDVARAHGARVELLPGGAVVSVVHGSSDTPAEQALRAARLALALRAHVGDSPISVVVGRTEITDAAAPVGEAIDRAARELATAPRGAIVVDEWAASLIAARFELRRDGDRHVLAGEKQPDAGVRRVLGRVTPFVGRRRELALLTSTLDDCAEESAARAVVVTGEAGMGKSRLHHELLARARVDLGDDVALLVAQADPMRAGSAYGMIAPAIRRAAGVVHSDALPERRAKLRARVERAFGGDSGASRVVPFVGELADIPFDDEADPELRAARRDPPAMQESIRRAFVAWLEAECRGGPRIVVLEDLHWGDRATVALFEDALRALDRSPLMVLALARPEVRELFPRLWETRHTTELRLSRLSKKAGATLARAVLGESIDEADVDRLVERSDGNAFFLEELLRAAASGAADELPDTVLGMVEARFAELEPDARFVLRAASVFGEVFWQAGIETMIGAGYDVGGWLDALCAEEVLMGRPVARFPGQRELAFRHALLRDASYAALTARDRTSAHRIAGEWLEAAGEDDPVLLAEHFERGAEGGRAATHYLRAARASLRGNDLDGAVRHAERGLACAGAEERVRGELWLAETEAFVWNGDPERGRRAALAALDLLPRGSAGWCTAIADLGDASMTLGTWEGVEPWVDALCDLAPGDEAVATQRVGALSRLAMALLLVGRADDSARVLDRVDADGGAAEARDPIVAGHAANARAAKLVMTRDRQTAIELFGAAADAFERGGALRHAAGSRSNQGAILLELGAYEDALRVLEAALAAAQKTRAAYTQGLTRLNYGSALAGCGELARGVAELRSAAEELRKGGDVRLESSARCALAEALLDAGDAAAAEREARRAVEATESHAPARAAALATLAAVLLATRRPDEALEAARRGMELRDAAPMEERETLLRVVHAEALAAAGSDSRARAELAMLIADVETDAARIASGALRSAFTTRVAANARAYALARAWGVTAGAGIATA